MQVSITLYSARSERLRVEKIDYNLLFRGPIGLSMDGSVRDHTTFTKNRDRLLETDIAWRNPASRASTSGGRR